LCAYLLSGDATGRLLTDSVIEFFFGARARERLLVDRLIDVSARYVESVVRASAGEQASICAFRPPGPRHCGDSVGHK